MEGRGRLLTVLAPLIGAAVLLTGCGSAQSAGTGPVPTVTTTDTSMPSAAEAKTIVADLWAHREAALTSLDANALKSVDTRAALVHDTGYVTFVACGCDQAKGAHPMLSVVTYIPRSSVDGAFMAAVRTDNGHGDKPWYIIGVERDAGRWAIGFLAFGGYEAKSVLAKVVKGDGSAPVTATTVQAYSAQASSWAHFVATHSPTTDKTDYGARVDISLALDPADGFVGLPLPNGRVLTCFTMHERQTYSMPGGLAQNDNREQWGPFLAPGGYATVTEDSTKPECTVGSGTKPGVEVANYDERVVATTGTSAG